MYFEEGYRKKKY